MEESTATLHVDATEQRVGFLSQELRDINTISSVNIIANASDRDCSIRDLSLGDYAANRLDMVTLLPPCFTGDGERTNSAF